MKKKIKNRYVNYNINIANNKWSNTTSLGNK